MDSISGFRNRLREALDLAGMSQTELARRLNVRVATVNEWLNRGTMPSGPIMLRLPGILGLDGHWLLTGERRPAAGSLPAEGGAYRAAMLMEEALRVLRGVDGSADAGTEGEVGRVRTPRADERLALEAVEAHQDASTAAERIRARRRSG